MTETFTIRIIEPTTCVSSLEARTYPSLEDAQSGMGQVAEKLTRAGTKEFLIHIINSTTGTVEKTLRRRMVEVPTYESD